MCIVPKEKTHDPTVGVARLFLAKYYMLPAHVLTRRRLAHTVFGRPQRWPAAVVRNLHEVLPPPEPGV
ncbi:hypothetical protein PHMEG_0006160 [Phytophthora megakarya]|uniref:Uncharacterized protein n=1 Tax=Phytophthora megakarya TaxID=4795 RepID=A0A225WPK5_9STRA|nr:hypothetical protein PHMEG_0006160 [Phytophthora megakarya]